MYGWKHEKAVKLLFYLFFLFSKRPAYYEASGLCNDLNLCHLTSEKPTIIWKSNYINFWVHKSFSLENINFDGSELFSKFSSNPTTLGWNALSDKAYKKEKCCTCAADGVCTATAGANCYCSAEYLYINILTSNYWAKWFKQTYLTDSDATFQHYRPFFGLFNLEFLADYSSASVPQLTIKVGDKGVNWRKWGDSRYATREMNL